MQPFYDIDRAEVIPFCSEGEIWLPALATAHSHAFQRAMRGQAQRPGPEGTDDFWTWRQAMYHLAGTLTPDDLFRIALVAFRELKRAGVFTVGEFHYMHHQPDGTPYDDRLCTSEAMIAAAREVGVRIALLRCVYLRGGPGVEPEGAQRRFCDRNLDEALADVDALRARYAGAEDVRIGLAPHSVRAVQPELLSRLFDYATDQRLVVHMHVAEQPKEIQQCLQETGRRPLELIAEMGGLSDRFVAVHATHLLPHEIALLGEARGYACICSTTERDLGDGLPMLGEMAMAGVRLVTGIDSHVVTNPIEDLRGLETGERLRTLKRVTDAAGVRLPGADVARKLWFVGSVQTAAACGFEDAGEVIAYDVGIPELELVEQKLLLDALVFGVSAPLPRRYLLANHLRAAAQFENDLRRGGQA